jgi:hypothetical protein
VTTVEEETGVESRRGGAPTRAYKVLERVELDDDGHAYQEVFEDGELGEGTVTARNTTNAFRKAFKAMRDARGDDFDEVVLMVVPLNQWKPTPVAAKRKESITVSVGR